MTGVLARAEFDSTPLVAPARVAMIRLYRLRAELGGIPLFDLEPSVSAIDLAGHLDRQGVGGDRRWSGVVFTSPRGLWRRIGYAKNPRRHDSPTPLFALNEPRAQELGY